MKFKEKIEALEQQMTALQSQIEVLKEIESKVEDKEMKPWTPQYGEAYYCISGGVVCEHENLDDAFDQEAIDDLAVFKTQEEAEFWAERFKVFRELSLFALEKVHNSGEGEVVYTIQYRRYPGTCYIDVWGASVTSTVVFESEEMASKAMEYVGEERLIKYWFRVESHGD